jgi:prophage regulatory protein
MSTQIIEPVQQTEDFGFYRLKHVLQIMGIGATMWWEGVKDGKFPKGRKIGRCTVWSKAEIRDLCERLSQ